MKISERAKSVPPSPIRKLVPFADRAKREGKKVYHLNIGQPDISSPREMIEAIKNIDLPIIAYGRSDGEPALKEELVRYYQRNAIDINPEELLVTTAGSEALIFAMNIVASPGDEIIVFEPFYTNYNGFSAQASVNLVPVTTRVENGFHLPPQEEIEDKITDKTKAILYCNPNNPTGTVLTIEEITALSEIVKKHDLFLIADEVYREFCYDDTEHISVMHIDGLEENAIMVDSISKRFSACGARIGCIVSRNEEVISSALRMGQARLCPPVIEQIGVISALKIPEKDYIGKTIKEYEKRRNYVFKRLEKMEGVFTLKPEGAFYMNVRLPVEDSEKFVIWLLSEYQSKDGETVMLAPSAGFYATEGMGKNEVRIAYVLNEDDLKRAMDCLEEALKIYKE
jgi:aspartate aminotransferase